MTEAIFNQAPEIEVGGRWLEELKRKAAQAPRRRFRLCLHQSHKDPIQEMVIVFCKDSRVAPHRHVQKGESFLVLEGELDVVHFDDDGNVTKKVALGAPGSGKPFLYRFPGSDWNTVVPRSDFVVLHETSPGPFDPAGEVKGPESWVRKVFEGNA